MTALLEADRLVKDFPGVRAVDGIRFAVPAGSCFGLLGPNGAGKTTTLEMLEGITPPSAGTVRFRGGALDRGYRETIGIQFQATALQEFQTTRESLALFGPWVRRGDVVLRAILFGVSSLLLYTDRPNTAVILVVFAVINLGLAFIIEPAAKADAFPEADDPPDSRRQGPPSAPAA